MAAAPASPPATPKQGWPEVPSPPNPTLASRVDELQRKVRVAISPCSATLLRAASRKKANKFASTGALTNPLNPVVPVHQQSQSEPTPGPSPNGKGHWRGKRRPTLSRVSENIKAARKVNPLVRSDNNASG